MTEFTLKEYTEEEYKNDLKRELEKTSLYNAIEMRCDLINDECMIVNMPYIPHRAIQEYMNEILDLIEIEKVNK